MFANTNKMAVTIAQLTVSKIAGLFVSFDVDKCDFVIYVILPKKAGRRYVLSHRRSLLIIIHQKEFTILQLH